MAFSAASLSLEQWLWCLLLGIRTLLQGQLVITVSTRKIPQAGDTLWMQGVTRLHTETQGPDAWNGDNTSLGEAV